MGGGRAGADRGPREDFPRIPRGRPDDPAIDDDLEPRQVPPELRRELAGFPLSVADRAGLHVLMTQRLLDGDPERAYAHAQVVRRLAGRLALAREVLGIAAYRTGRWSEAATELRTARRMTGRPDLLPLLVDVERALGRPERALQLAADPDSARLDPAGRVELAIVSAGARRDLGQAPAAVAALQALRPEADTAWAPRLRYALADALLESGRRDDAVRWFTAASEVDRDGATDAAARLAELEGRVLEQDPEVWDLEDLDDEQVPATPAEEDAADAIGLDLPSEGDGADRRSDGAQIHRAP